MNIIIRSSANPENISLTIKGLVSLLVLSGIDSQIADTLGNEILNAVVALGILFSSIITAYGIIRKISNALN